jgi:ubiquinone/menaquinone biosynthesis C-methylase UbiE
LKPLSHTSTNDKVIALVRPHLSGGARVVDVGAGEGYFSSKLGEIVERELGRDVASTLSACDVFPSNFRYGAIRCDLIDVATGRLPYEDATFDVACSLEVVEHVPDQFAFAHELFRVLRPGGTAMVSTPNVLNMNSRLRTLHSGFAVLFDPLPLSSDDPVHTSGHINPVSYYYLAYALRRAGFTEVRAEYDRFKSSARALLALFGPIVFVGNALFRRRMNRRKLLAAGENATILDAMSSVEMLTSRSVIAVATKL